MDFQKERIQLKYKGGWYKVTLVLSGPCSFADLLQLAWHLPVNPVTNLSRGPHDASHRTHTQVLTPRLSRRSLARVHLAVTPTKCVSYLYFKPNNLF